MKLRQPGSLEDALTIAAGILGWGALAIAAGKSESLLRQASNPDEPAEVQLRQAARIDKACKEQSNTTPLLDWYGSEVAAASFKSEGCNLKECALKATGALGRMVETIRIAKLPDSPGGVGMTINEQIQVRQTIADLKIIVSRMEAEVLSANTSNVVGIDK